MFGEPPVGVDPTTATVILGMATATYLTKAGGLWLLNRVELSDRMEAGLDVLPGAIVVSILVPEVVGSGPATWAAALAVLAVAWLTDSDLLALGVGIATVVLLRGVV